MMKRVAQMLVGLLGLGSVAMALSFWFRLGGMATQFGILPQNLTGLATVRADIAGLFLGMGFIMLIAAVHQSRMWSLAAIIMVSAALAGRFVTMAISGTDAGTWPPVAVEVIGIALLLWARNAWSKAD
jgi:hypothetical protein